MTRAFDAVLFDLDDTLLDWSGVRVDWHDEYARLLEPVHALFGAEGLRPPAIDAFTQAVREGAMDEWRRAKVDHTAPLFENAFRRALTGLGYAEDALDQERAVRVFGERWRLVPGVVPFPDALEVLDVLLERGYRLGLVTNSMQPMWMRDRELAGTGLIERLAYRVAAADVGYIKPHRLIFEQAAAALGVTVERTVFVGDRPANDIAGANAVGMTSVLMSPAHLQRDPEGHEPDHEIAMLSELLALLD
jgi:putative hydrolase of the HAD superfamily